MSELWRRGAGELAGMIALREVTSAEVVEAHLDRIAAVNPQLNAITRVLDDDARLRPRRLTGRSPAARPSAGCTASRSRSSRTSTSSGRRPTGVSSALADAIPAARLAGGRADEGGRRDPDRPHELPRHGAARPHRLRSVRADPQPVEPRPHRWRVVGRGRRRARHGHEPASASATTSAARCATRPRAAASRRSSRRPDACRCARLIPGRRRTRVVPTDAGRRSDGAARGRRAARPRGVVGAPSS